MASRTHVTVFGQHQQELFQIMGCVDNFYFPIRRYVRLLVFLLRHGIQQVPICRFIHQGPQFTVWIFQKHLGCIELDLVSVFSVMFFSLGRC